MASRRAPIVRNVKLSAAIGLVELLREMRGIARHGHPPNPMSNPRHLPRVGRAIQRHDHVKALGTRRPHAVLVDEPHHAALRRQPGRAAASTGLQPPCLHDARMPISHCRAGPRRHVAVIPLRSWRRQTPVPCDGRVQVR